MILGLEMVGRETLDPCSKDSNIEIFFAIFYVICIFEYLDIDDYKAGFRPAQIYATYSIQMLVRETLVMIIAIILIAISLTASQANSPFWERLE